jgi:triosephosphate isomerase (TIM)
MTYVKEKAGLVPAFLRYDRYMSKLIIGNWKSHKTIAEAQQWLGEFLTRPVSDNVHVVLAPPLPFLPVLQWHLKDAANITLGAQIISPYPAGSYTGAVSAYNLKDLGVTHAVLGHSEQRRYFKVTSQDVAKQVDQCLSNNIIPVVCVDSEYLAEQAQAIANEQLGSCIVAYEPTEAIGSGNDAPPEKVKGMVDRINTVFGDVLVLYGGSVDPDNVAEHLSMTDGCIVGTASLDVNEFSELIKNAS